MSENNKIANNEKADVTDSGTTRVIKGELEVLKGRGPSVNGEPLTLLLEDYDRVPVELTVKRL